MEKKEESRAKGLFELKFSNMVLAVSIVFCTGLSIGSSLLLGGFIDFLSGRTAFDRDSLMYLAMILAALLLAVAASILFAQYLPLRLQLKKSMEYSRGVMDGLLKISDRNYQSREKGYYINLVTSSAFTCGDIYGHLNVDLVGNVLCVILMIGIAFYINPLFGLAYLLYIPIFALLTQSPNKKIAAFQKAGLPTQDAFLSGTKKIVEDKRAINIARAEAYYSNLYQQRSEKYLSFITKFRWYSILSKNLPTLLSSLLTVATLGIAAKLYFDATVTIGTVFVIFQLSQLLQGPLNRCFEILIHRSINEVHMERIQDFREQQYEKSGFEEAYREMGDLAFAMEGKVFSSADRERLLFSADGIAVRKNQLIVVKGGNGTGKSTLSNLLTGFTDIEIFDGTLQLDHILAGASYLSRPILFADGDIKENMFGREIDPEVFEMLGISFEDKIINESGSNLSFGEQQKLGLLRVLSSDARVIILDEPFTNLDRESISRVAAFIEKIKKGKTIIAIMHSAEMDVFADLIFEIREGKLVSIKK